MSLEKSEVNVNIRNIALRIDLKKNTVKTLLCCLAMIEEYLLIPGCDWTIA